MTPTHSVKWRREIEPYRITQGEVASPPQVPYGAFQLPHHNQKHRQELYYGIICSDGEGWDHVSVQIRSFSFGQPHRVPTWEEMCHIKSLFFEDEETVMQLHPPKSQWVNVHNFVLHLWRPQKESIPLPPREFV